MPWRSPSRLRSEPGAAARQAPFAGGRLLTVMMPRGYYRPTAAVQPTETMVIRASGPLRNLSDDQLRLLGRLSPLRRATAGSHRNPDTPGTERSFTRGIVPRTNSTAGRPCQCDSSDEADTGLEHEAGGLEDHHEASKKSAP